MHAENSVISQWKKWNAQGLIPGPDESEAAFQERVAFCQNLDKNLEQAVGIDFPFDIKDQPSKEILDEVLLLTQELYGIEPHWILLFFSNYHLAPWHGGCAWIFQLNDQTPTAAFLQLRAHFRKTTHFLGIYQRSELIAHELAHVGRMLYQEPQFEEILAYQTSSSRWRRWLGPIVQSSKESFFFILLLGLAILTDFAVLSLGPQMTALAWWTRLLPLVFFVLALGRLVYRNQIFKHCLQKLETLYSPLEARHLLYRLRDREIKHFSHLSPLKIREFMDEADHSSFRWHFLKTLYPSSNHLS